MERVSKGDLIDNIAGSVAGVSKKDTATIIDMLLQRISDATANGHQVVIKGFGTFEPRHRVARIGRNPRTGADVPIPASTTMGFRAAKAKAQG